MIQTNSQVSTMTTRDEKYQQLDVVDRQSAETLNSFFKANATSGRDATRLANLFALQSLWMAIPLAIADSVSLYLCLMISGRITQQLLSDPMQQVENQTAVFAALLIIPIAQTAGLYPGIGQSTVMEFRQIFRSLLAALVAFLGIGIFCFPEHLTFYVVCTSVALAAMPLAITARFLVRRLAKHFPLWGVPTLIVAEPRRGMELYRKIERAVEQGFRPVGVLLSPNHYWHGSKLLEDRGIPAFDLRRTNEIASQYGVTWAIVSPCVNRNLCAASDSTFAAIPNRILLSSNQLDMGLWDDLFCVGSTTGIRLGGTHPSSFQLIAKRWLDLSLTITALMLGAPLLLFFCFMIKLSSRGPIFYGQKRIGQHGREFTAWKFRSMVDRADEVLNRYLDRNPEAKAEWELKHKLANDPRVTKIGNFLRRTSLDELPQLWNVLRGEMSLVGPRPIVDSPTYDAAYVHNYPDEFEAYKTVRPGLTGLWQVSSRSDGVYEFRVYWDMYYIRNWSIWLDVYLILRTIKTVLLREGSA